MSIIPWWCGFWPIKIDISAQALMTGRYTCLFTLWLADLPAFSILWLADSPACSPCHWLIHLPIHRWLADLPADSSLNLDHWHFCRQFHPVSSNHTVSSPDVCVLSVLHGVSVPASAYAPPAPPWLHRLPLAARVWHYGPRLPVSHGNHRGEVPYSVSIGPAAVSSQNGRRNRSAHRKDAERGAGPVPELINQIHWSHLSRWTWPMRRQSSFDPPSDPC